MGISPYLKKKTRRINPSFFPVGKKNCPTSKRPRPRNVSRYAPCAAMSVRCQNMFSSSTVFPQL
ncbi:hypothetical protein HBH68_123280 [Parastagonospora nodorum]|nr:hypothetical protein HBH71_160250 [Parastagonospora nodorum]KAH5201454.1 hypothetical protein HBH68_123280 [Parastagonospora nodorum]KAH5695767.1 hypothetical protein HBI44_119590 [Parastagonospora nodorum]KAH6540002.1 hypothetical protein HBI07_112190 [Parastagonospora nodorum]